MDTIGLIEWRKALEKLAAYSTPKGYVNAVWVNSVEDDFDGILGIGGNQPEAIIDLLGKLGVV